MAEEIVTIGNLVEKYGALIENTTKTIKSKYYLKNIDYDDIRQIIYEEFIKALKKFDPSRGTKFHTYALACVKNKFIVLMIRSNRNKENVTIEKLGDTFTHDPVDRFLGGEIDVSALLDNNLDKAEKHVLKMRMENYTLKCIGESFDNKICAERVRQIEQSGICKLLKNAPSYFEV